MKLFVVFLVVGLSSSEKLNRAYLPPPGAKTSGGSSEYLQTPLEYPKETPFYGQLVNTQTSFGDEAQKPGSSNGYARNFDGDVKIGDPAEESFPTIPTKNPLYYTETAYATNPNSGFETTVQPSFEQKTIQNTQRGETSNSLGLLNGYTNNQGTSNHYESLGTGYHFGKSGNMPIIALPEGVIQSYQPNAFGMYGGSPMIIKAHSGLPMEPANVNGEYNRNNDNPASELYKLDQGIIPISQLPGAFTDSSSKQNDKSRSETLFTTASPGTTLSSRPSTRNEYFKKRPERPQSKSDRTAVILNYENVLTPEGYSYSFDTSNGIHQDESASTTDGVKAQGSYSYTGDDGKVYTVWYTADENGFQPRGDHLPTPPPIPKAIQKLIEQAKIDKEAGIVHDGSYNEEKYGHMKYQGPVNRYLQNMNTISGVKNHNRKLGQENRVVLNNRANFVKKNGIIIVQTLNEQRMNKLSTNNLNGKFGIKNVPTTEPRVTGNKIKVKNNKIHNENRRPIGSMENNKDKLEQKLRKPIGNNNYELQQTIGKLNKIMQDGNSLNGKDQGRLNKIKQTNNIVISNPYQTQDSNSNTTPQEGYFYVPPVNIFTEGRLQDQPAVFQEAPNKYGKMYDNVDKVANPVPQLYYIDQTGQNNYRQEKPISKMINYISSTGEPRNQKEYEGDSYKKNNHDDERITTLKLPSTGIKETITTAKPFVYTLSMNPDKQDYNDAFAQEEKTMSPENRDGFLLTKNDIIDTSYHTTTPMTSQTQYTSQLMDDSNQYETTYPSTGFVYKSPNSITVYPENEGYFKTTPDKQATFEDFPSSTAIYPVDNEANMTPNIKVDGFGRPIQDVYDHNVNLHYSGNVDETNDKSRTMYNLEEKITDKSNPGEDKSKTDTDNGSDIEMTTAIYFGNKEEAIIGEDFSGPQQPQRYDPETGYFY